jgi:hypothetical protein
LPPSPRVIGYLARRAFVAAATPLTRFGEKLNAPAADPNIPLLWDFEK